MDKIYDQTTVEQKWYDFWEKEGLFKPEVHPDGQPYTIIMPPPNANESLHIGHARFITIEDVLIRFARMQGKAALWLPGTDHAGIETQFVFEKKLAAEGKSRFNFDNKTLYKMVWDYVQNYRNVAINQIKKLGASADWSREKFTLDPEIVTEVHGTFFKLVNDNLIYRGETLVNFCTNCGTSYSELEVDHKEQTDKIYTLDYGPVKIATTRPETIFADVAVAVNPEDDRFKNLIGKTAKIPLINVEVPIIADEAVEKDFGTGALKITPAHDKADWEVGQKHNLEVIKIIDETGRLMNHFRVPEKYQGMRINPAREAVVADLGEYLIEEKALTHAVGVCYRCKRVIEPMLSTQWFMKIRDLADKAANAVKTGETNFPAKHYEKIYLHWLENLRDWNISRQIVWGIPIPIFYSLEQPEKLHVLFLDKDEKQQSGFLNEMLNNGHTITEIRNGLIKIRAEKDVEWTTEDSKSEDQEYLPETDTFDTWFSSGQWPVITLKTNQPGDFEKYYPTAVMETAYDILAFWVVRMMMFGIYLTGKAPFKDILLHGLVRDGKGEKISKSKGNVIDPLEMTDKYGTDAVRAALCWGALVENDVALSEQNIKGQRNFTNKLWNIGRFLIDFKPENCSTEISNHPDDQEIITQLNNVITETTKALEQYRLNDAIENLYEFIWHQFADVYIEKTKERRAEAQPALEYVFRTSLELLHPFMPFLTEELWQKLPHEGKSIMITPWPKPIKNIF